MPTARTRANRKFNEKAYDRLAIVVPKGCKRLIEAAASEAGESVNGFVNSAILARMGLTEWSKQPED